MRSAGLEREDSSMQNRERAWLWLSAAVSSVVGFILVLNDSGAGWFLIIMGIVYIGASTRAGQELPESDPTYRRWGLVSVTVLLVALTVIVGALVSCGPAPEPALPPTQAGLPNPASVFCEEHGGRLDIRTEASGGQVGICIFPDGSECEEWAFLRNECQPASMATQLSAPTSAPIVDPAATPPAGWEAYTHPTLGYSFFYPAGSTFESTDPAQYTLVVGPLEADDHWPWFNIAHPDESDYHPPSDIDLQAWLAEASRLPGEVLGTRSIAGEAAVHTRFDDPRGPQAYSDDRYYFVHDGQLYELTIMHTGKEDWSVYDRFLDSFHF
jgi:putative hemolysin